jgi:hypothetical protein
MLLAYRNGADVAITIDDDNFVSNQDFVGLHGVAGTSREMAVYASTSGWLNVCGFLESDGGAPFYHRGYPRKIRWTESEHFVTTQRTRRRVAVNAGFSWRVPRCCWRFRSQWGVGLAVAIRGGAAHAGRYAELLGHA